MIRTWIIERKMCSNTTWTCVLARRECTRSAKANILSGQRGACVSLHRGWTMCLPWQIRQRRASRFAVARYLFWQVYHRGGAPVPRRKPRCCVCTPVKRYRRNGKGTHCGNHRFPQSGHVARRWREEDWLSRVCTIRQMYVRMYIRVYIRAVSRDATVSFHTMTSTSSKVSLSWYEDKFQLSRVEII